MTIQQAKELMEIELQCVQRNATESCDRVCAHCDLVQDTQNLIKAYERVITYIDSASRFYGG